MRSEHKELVAGLIVLLVSGCGSTSSPPSSPSNDGALSERDAAVLTPPLPYYEVPVDDPSLAPHAFFSVPDVHYVVADGIVTLDYDFPEELSGVFDQTVELRGPVDADGGATISGPQGTGTCTVASGVVRCIEYFSALPVDAARAHSLAGAYGTDTIARGARLAVIDRFVADPIGIVVFDLAEASEPSGGDDDD